MSIKNDIKRVLKKIEFPAHKRELVEEAKISGRDILDILEGLPEHTYDSLEDVWEHVREEALKLF